MKKIIISILIIISIVAALPILGNKIIEETLDKKIAKLESKGVEVLKKEHDSGYLNTSRHYEFIDNGNKYGLDLKYSNIPLTEDVTLELYPLSAPKNILDDLSQKDKGFAQYVEKFLENKGILYHLDYNLISGEFNGFVKDIDESYTMKNNSKLVVKVFGTKFKGKGDLRSPSTMQTSSKKIKLEVKDARDIMAIDISNAYLDASSNFSAQKAQIASKFYFDTIFLKSNNRELNATSFNYDINISNMDKQAYKEFISSKQSEKTLIKLLSKGIDIDIGDLSLKNAHLNQENLKGFKISSDMQLEKDKNLGLKMKISPLLALPNLEIDFKSKISQKIVAEIIKNSLIPNTFIKYQTSSGDDVVFDISYQQGVLVVNGKTILG